MPLQEFFGIIQASKGNYDQTLADINKHDQLLKVKEVEVLVKQRTDLSAEDLNTIKTYIEDKLTKESASVKQQYEKT